MSTRVLNRQRIIEELKAGVEIVGEVIWGYHIRGGIYDGWTVRSDTLVSLLQKGLVAQERDKISHYSHYRWKHDN